MIASPVAPVPDSPAVESSLRFRDLGSLAVEVAGVDTPVRGMRPARILSMLLVNGNRRVSIDTLVDAVWGLEASDATIGTLESHIWRLRKLLEPGRNRRAKPTYLVNDNLGYRLILNADTADSLRFAQLAEQGDRLLGSGDADRALARYDLALQLWRGRPFDAVADEQWAAASIARLVELHEHVHEQRIEALLRVGAPHQAITELGSLTALMPFRERLWSQLMLALYQAGRVQEALDTYRRARGVLLDTLGLEPGPALREVQQRILDQDPALASDRPRPSHFREPAGAPAAAGVGRETHLPSRLSALIGRATELDRVAALLRRSRLVTLIGAGGCGKTRLAIEVARSAADVAPDGVWFVDLAVVEDPASVVGAVVSTIGLEQPPVGTALAALRRYVRDRQILLLVDNCEHLLPAVHDLCDALLGEDSQCRILATSREPVGLDGELLWSLAPLAVRGERASTVKGMSPAAQLFVARAQGADPMFEPTAAAMAEIEAICVGVDGIPLAIELAAGRVRSASLAEVRHQVSTGLAALGRVGYARTEHHRTVEVSIEWSVRLLTDAERAVHARLSTLPGVFTVDAARVVAGAAPVTPAQVPDLLTQLVNRSLLAVVPGEQVGEPTRFRQLATVRAHGIQALEASGESAATLDRRTAFVGELVAACPRVYEPDTTGWYASADRNHDTLTAVLNYTLHDRPDPVGAHLAASLSLHWFYHGRVFEGTRWLRAALDQTAAAPGDRARAELALAWLFAMRDRTDLSLPLVRSAVATPDAQVDRRDLACGMFASAWVVGMRDEPALGFVEGEVRRLAADDPGMILWADLLAALAELASDGPDVGGARARLLADRAEGLGDVFAAWLAAWLVVRCAVLTGDAAGGRNWLRRVNECHRSLGGAGPADDAVEFEANLAALAGDHEQAAELFGRSSAMAFRSGTRWPSSPATEPILARVRHALPADRFDAAWQRGDATT